MTIWTRQEIAAKSGLSLSTVSREIRRGNLSPKCSYDCLGYSDSDIQDWLIGRQERGLKLSEDEQALLIETDWSIEPKWVLSVSVRPTASRRIRRPEA